MWDIETKSTIYFQPSKRASPVEVYAIKNKPQKCKLHEEKTIAWVSGITNAQDRNILIAAPELLNALKEMLVCFVITMNLDEHDQDFEGYKYEAVKNARAAVLKATGEVN